MRRGLGAFSAGNHAAAVAHVGGILGVPVTVCMPAHAVARKIQATRALGAEVVLVEQDLVGTAHRIFGERGLTLLHPFDDPAVVAGHAGAGLELIADLPEVDLVVVPVGGGGLISGVSSAVKQLSPSARVVGVEPELADVVSRSLAAGEPVTQPGPTSVADGLTAPITGAVPFAHIQSFVDSVVRVPDAAILEALGVLVRDEGIPANRQPRPASPRCSPACSLFQLVHGSCSSSPVATSRRSCWPRLPTGSSASTLGMCNR